MGGFKFRLQSVLEYRHQLVERLQAEVYALQQRVRDEEARLSALQLAENRTLARLQQQRAGVIDMAETLHLTQHLDVLLQRIAEQRQVIELARVEADQRQQALVEANTELKAMEKLRDRQEDEFSTEVRRVEQIQTDEVAILQHRRLRAAL